MNYDALVGLGLCHAWVPGGISLSFCFTQRPAVSPVTLDRAYITGLACQF